MTYVEGIFTSVCTSLCVRSFPAILGLENLRKQNGEQGNRIMGHHFGHFKLGRILLYLMYCTSGQMCAAKHVQAQSGPFMLFSFNFGLFSVNSC